MLLLDGVGIRVIEDELKSCLHRHLEWLDDVVAAADEGTWLRWIKHRNVTKGQIGTLHSNGSQALRGFNTKSVSQQRNISNSAVAQKRRLVETNRAKNMTAAQNVLRAVKRRKNPTPMSTMQQNNITVPVNRRQFPPHVRQVTSRPSETFVNTVIARRSGEGEQAINVPAQRVSVQSSDVRVPTLSSNDVTTVSDSDSIPDFSVVDSSGNELFSNLEIQATLDSIKGAQVDLKSEKLNDDCDTQQLNHDGCEESDRTTTGEMNESTYGENVDAKTEFTNNVVVKLEPTDDYYNDVEVDSNVSLVQEHKPSQNLSDPGPSVQNSDVGWDKTGVNDQAPSSENSSDSSDVVTVIHQHLSQPVFPGAFVAKPDPDPPSMRYHQGDNLAASGDSFRLNAAQTFRHSIATTTALRNPAAQCGPVFTPISDSDSPRPRLTNPTYGGGSRVIPKSGVTNVLHSVATPVVGNLQHQAASTNNSKDPIMCQVCGKKFTFRSNLSRHMSVHPGYSPFICRFCTKCFRNAANLQNHMVRSHPEFMMR